MHIVIIPGDGIGPETMQVSLALLNKANDLFDLGLQLTHDIAGHDSLRQHGATVTQNLLEKVKAADGLLLGPMATYDFKDESKGEINPSKFFRKNLDLYANIRPAKTYTGIKTLTGPFDLVVVRENTEGFYADRNMALGHSEILVTNDVAISMRRITRECSERIARSAFELARLRQKRLTLVHKANVLRITDGFIVDAMMAHVVRAPEKFDVIVTTNMFGDILSDLTAELSGSLGLGGSLNAGAQHAMGQAAHGSAPDIAWRNIANPFSQVLSAAMLLAWHASRHDKPHFWAASQAMEKAVSDCVASGDCTRDIGGRLGTRETGEALCRRLQVA